jgi:hypothetical protein
MNYRVGVFLFGVFSLPVLGLIISLQGGGGDAFSGVMPVFCIVTFLIGRLQELSATRSLN